MQYVLKYHDNYVGNDGNFTTVQAQAARLSAALKPFLNPDAGYRVVRIRPRVTDNQETETARD